MTTIKDSFQKEIKYKLSQKSNTHISEETVLLKAFKYFDLNNTQEVDKEVFIKVIEKIGIIIYNKEDFYDLFHEFSEGQEKLNYFQFIQQLFGGKTGTTRKLIQKEKQIVEELQQPKIENIFSKLQQDLCGRGPSALINIGITFKKMDIYNKSQNIIDFQDLMQCFEELKFVSLTKIELQELFNYFDTRQVGLLNYIQFLLQLLNQVQPFSARKHQIIQKIFSSILQKEQANQEILSIEKLTDNFHAENHPDVKKNIVSQEYIQKEFESTLRDFYTLRGQGDGCISLEEFEEFYKFTSFYITNDDDFENILENVWKKQEPQQKQLVSEDYQSQKAQSSQKYSEKSFPIANQFFQFSIQLNCRYEQSPQPIILSEAKQPQKQQAFYSRAAFDKIKSKLLLRGVKGLLGIQFSFKLGDVDKDSMLTYKEFIDILQLFNIFLEKEEQQSIFTTIDRFSEGVLKIDQLVKEIRGEMNNFRKSIIIQIFKELDRAQEGFLKISDIKTLYNPVNHPEVLNGNKTQNDVVNDFIETFEQHHQLFNVKKSTSVSFQQFMDYYHNISATIPNDQYFEVLALNSFKIFNKPAYQGSEPNSIIAAGQRTHCDLANQFGDSANKISKTIMNAPFGTSNIQTDYSTFLRPQTSNQYQGQQQVSAAGAPSWPGLNQLYSAQQASYQQAKGEMQMQSFQQKEENSPEAFFQTLKQKLMGRGLKAGILNFLRQIQRFSNPQTNTITLDQFLQILMNLRMNDSFSESFIKQLFYSLAGQSELLEVSLFISTFKPRMSQNRKEAVDFIFSKLDKKSVGIISLDDVRFNFNPRGHPDVANKIKTEDEVLGDFLDTFEQNHAIFCKDPKLRNQMITIEEFENYYENVSYTIPDDNKFIQIVIKTWELE